MSGGGVIITGGFGALGRVAAARFAAEGYRVARVDFAPQAPDENTGGLDLAGIDLTDAAAADLVMQKVNAEFGGVRVLVNIAGGFVWEAIGGGRIESWQRMYAMNVVTAANMTMAALPALKAAGGARIINMGAGAAVKADTGMGAYAASKAGVHRLTESLAAELGGDDVTVNAILPSIIDTPTNRADMPDADMRQWVSPEAIANVMLFLASPAARAISGALIPVTRGG